ncbi:PcfJ domain-containing protein [Paenibacillus elgii]|uniref:PcfJ domain-containing protein n=1 Tax=Paenibacillus elgii TaxID=189691 RepID=UPI0018D3E8DF|nr:PcfJ domain-containing protein [Paenibacillus elgii]
MVDRVYLLWYEKSVIDPKAVIARGFYAVRDYTKDYQQTETVIRPIAMYLFEWGKGGKMVYRNYWNNSSKWQESKKVYSEATQSMKYVASYHSDKNIKSAVKGTPFQYCTWEEYDFEDHVRMFDLAARYKCIEFLTKYGLGCLIKSKMSGEATYGAINWRGKTPEKVLRLNKTEMKALKASELSIDAQSLRCYQLSKKDGTNFTWEEAHAMADLLSSYWADEFSKLTVHAPALKIKRYFVKQIKRTKSRFVSGSTVLTAWRDYLRECRELGKNLQKDSVLFPNDLHKAHQETSQQIKLKKNEELNADIRIRAGDLQPFCFEFNGLLLRPAASNEELFEEGKALIHCVAGYGSKYAKGLCDIFLVRRVDEPDKPFYTMEVIKGTITQCYGYDNKVMTPQVREFVNAFIEEKLQKKKSRVKVAAQQEVAV